MDFAVRYTPEQEEFRTRVSDWLDANLPRSLVDSVEHDDSPERYVERRAFGRALGATGWLYPAGPAQYGGGGLPIPLAMVVAEELHSRGLGLPPYYDSGGALGSVAIRVWGDERQRAAFLPPIYRGERRTWQLLTEPSGGSDLAACRSYAVRDGDDYLVTGEKVFVGSANGADDLWTIVRTGPAADRHRNLSWLLIDASLPGVTIQPLHLLDGDHKFAVHFDNVRVPAFNLVGGENRGWEVATTHLELEHGLRTDSVIGTRLDRYWGAVVEEFAKRRRDPPADEVARAQDALAQAYVRKEVVRLLGLRNYWLSSGREPLDYQGSQAYLIEKLTTQWLAHSAVDVLGADALADTDGSRSASLVQALQTEGIYAMHGGGTAEIQKMIIARRLGLGREREAAGRLVEAEQDG